VSEQERAWKEMGTVCAWRFACTCTPPKAVFYCSVLQYVVTVCSIILLCVATFTCNLYTAESGRAVLKMSHCSSRKICFSRTAWCCSSALPVCDTACRIKDNVSLCSSPSPVLSPGVSPLVLRSCPPYGWIVLGPRCNPATTS